MTTASTEYAVFAVGIRHVSFDISSEVPPSPSLTAAYGSPQVLVMPLHFSVSFCICLLSLHKLVIQVNIPHHEFHSLILSVLQQFMFEN